MALLSFPSSLHWRIFAFSQSLKLLVGLYSYRSTDFDVHWNWKALVQGAPLSRWYCDSPGHRQWTLDYPPLFALFELILSLPVRALYPGSQVLELEQKDPAEFSTVLYMRCTVLVSDLILLFGLITVARVVDCQKGGT